jgi:hypothetical protein
MGPDSIGSVYFEGMSIAEGTIYIEGYSTEDVEVKGDYIG